MAERLFVDGSILVAALAEEEGFEASVSRIRGAQSVFTSPVAVVETSMALSRMGMHPDEAHSAVRRMLAGLAVRLLELDGRTATWAIKAFARYGKGRHPARLNLGDCFSYACAKEHGLTLLYKGDNFARTDLA